MDVDVNAIYKEETRNYQQLLLVCPFKLGCISEGRDVNISTRNDFIHSYCYLKKYQKKTVQWDILWSSHNFFSLRSGNINLKYLFYHFNKRVIHQMNRMSIIITSNKQSLHKALTVQWLISLISFYLSVLHHVLPDQTQDSTNSQGGHRTNHNTHKSKKLTWLQSTSAFISF